MLEKLWIREERERNFVFCFALSTIFTFASIIIARYIVPFKVSGYEFTGFMSVVLTSLAASYPLIKYLEDEQEIFEEGKVKDSSSMFDLLDRHKSELEIYLIFFLGVSLAFGVSNAFIPESFEVQHEVIGSIRPDVATGRIFSPGFFTEILTNNLSVFLVTFILSFFLTAGMIFVLVWNASILGVFISEISKGIVDVPIMVLSYLPHGILEISAYIIAGLSGFFLSHEVRSVVQWEDKAYAMKLMGDSFLFFGIGLVVLVVAALIESTGV